MSGPPANVAAAKPLSAAEAIIALLYCPDGRKDNGEWRWAAPIEGRTRLVKELFLVSKETKSGASGLFGFEFTPGPYGPSSFAVTNELRSLVRAGKVGTLPLESGRGERILLAPAGGKTAKELWPRLSGEVRSDMYGTKSRYASFTYRQLMVYVYRTYPEFTTNSLIREEVLEDAME